MSACTQLHSNYRSSKIIICHLLSVLTPVRTDRPARKAQEVGWRPFGWSCSLMLETGSIRYRDVWAKVTYCVKFTMIYPIVTAFYLYVLFLKSNLPQENTFNLAAVLTLAYLPWCFLLINVRRHNQTEKLKKGLFGVDRKLQRACALSGQQPPHTPTSKYLPDMSQWVVAHPKKHAYTHSSWWIFELLDIHTRAFRRGDKVAVLPDWRHFSY